MSKSRLTILVLLAAVVLSVGATASTSTPWNLYYSGYNNDNKYYGSCVLNYRQGSSWDAGAAAAGAFDMYAKFDGNPVGHIWTYCIDMAVVRNGSIYTRYNAEITPAASSIPPMTVAAWQDLAWLNENFFDDSLTSNAKSAGFQFVLWDRVFNSGLAGNDYRLHKALSSGSDFYVTGWGDSTAWQYGNSCLEALQTARNTGFVDYTNKTVFYVDGQNQMGHNAVPEWPVAALAPFGLGILGYVRRRLMA